MNKIANYTKYKNDLLKKHFGNYAGLFLGQLIYWSNHKNNYGIQKNGKVWIYNTLEDWAEQLECSSKTIQRAVKYLKEEGVIETAFMSKNKRDRTIFYSVNYEKLSEKINFTNKNVQMNVQMIHIYNKQKNNKSDKSKNLKKKNTIVQDMTLIWNEMFPENNIKLTKEISRYLVAAFKLKFEKSLETWKNYLKLLKNNQFIKFGKSIFDYIKFSIIDKFMEENVLGINREQNLKDAINHIENVNEPQKCKDFRYEIMRKLSPEKYNSWFTKVDLFEEFGKMKMIVKNGSAFVRDYIITHFCINQEIALEI